MRSRRSTRSTAAAGPAIGHPEYTGQDITIDGEAYLMLREDDVLAILDSK